MESGGEAVHQQEERITARSQAPCSVTSTSGRFNLQKDPSFNFSSSSRFRFHTYFTGGIQLCSSSKIVRMDQQGNPIGQHPYGMVYPPNHMPTPTSGGPHSSIQSAGTEFLKHMVNYQQTNQPDHPQLRQQLQTFWSSQTHEISKSNDFKNHSLPLARIKKIMKADGDVRMISAEAPVIFARACEMFILELTLRSWNHTEENRRRTLQKNDIAASISRTDIFDFLVDTVPKEEALKDDVLGGFNQETVPVVAQPDALPYYYTSVGLVSGNGVMMGTPVVDPNVYSQQSQGYMAPAMWQQQPLPPIRAPPPHMQPPPSDD